MAGRFVLAATPIGNDADASTRLREVLASADVVAAEDTRRTRKLAARLGVEITGRLVSLHEHNESERLPELLEAVRGGALVALVTDAGMPTVSDPGYRVVAAAVAEGLDVTCAPGPSAVLAALALSGLATDRFCFEGFPPRKPGERARALRALAHEPRTMVFFEAPHRLAVTLEAMTEAFGPERPAAVCRELTKTYEEVVRGPLAELAEWAREDVRGEIVVVVAGAPPREASLDAVVGEVLARVESGERLKDAVRELARSSRIGQRELYAAALAAKG